MFLAEIFADNFRVFGPHTDGKALNLRLQPGLNALVGENDGGKSAVIDAIRFCLWTTSQEYHRLTEDDFHCGATGRATNLTIRCKFEELEVDDQATFMEWLTTPDGGTPVLYLNLRATRLEGKRRGRVAVEMHSGENGEGPAIEGMVRELLKTTYLRPLRDAEAELSPGRNSRLSQILVSHPEIATQAEDDFDPAVDGSGRTLVGIMKRAEHEVGRNETVVSANEAINTKYLERFQIGAEALKSEVGVAGDTTLNRILEKLELVISKPDTSTERTRRGLGYNNALFMSAELLLLGSREAYPTLLIEEPEAHLHPQMQASVIALLNEKTSTPVADGDVEPEEDAVVAEDGEPAPAANEAPETPGKPVQVLMTTHSPNLASAIPIDRLTMICSGKAYSLAPAETRLSNSDYSFLERFLDSTKANLFFAKGVAIVEGDAENLLLPALAEKTGYSFRKNGLSVVNVGHTGLFRYSNIFRRQDDVVMPVRVACIRDRDIVPDCAPDELKKKLKKEAEFNDDQRAAHIAKLKARDGGSVVTFVSNWWTFEYDLAAASWEMAAIMHRAIQCAVEAEDDWPNEAKVAEVCRTSDQAIEAWKVEPKDLANVAVEVYAPLRKGNASKAIAAQFAAKFVSASDVAEEHLPSYLVDAFKHLTGV